MEDRITLDRAEQRRLLVLNHLEAGALVNAEAAELLGISIRQVRRLRAAYRERGAAALAHGNRGRRPAHALDPALALRVVELATSTYAGFNHQHLTEMLAEHEGIQLSRPSVHRILTQAGVASARTRRPAQHRRRRERMPREGMLLQIDGSRHDWLEGRGPYLTLIGAVDDATGIVPWACFRDQEDAHGYFQLLAEVVRRRGVPLATQIVLERYVARHNRRFAVPAADLTPAWLPWPKERRRNEVFCFKYRRVVANDNTIHVGKLVIDIPPDRQRISYAHCQVEVQRRFDGTTHVLYEGRHLTAVTDVAADPENYRLLDIKARTTAAAPPALPRSPSPPAPDTVTWKPPPTHPWKRYAAAGVAAKLIEPLAGQIH